MNISKEEVKKMLNLSRISYTSCSALLYTQDLSKIINLFNQLKEINTKDINPLYNVNDCYLRLRKDFFIKTNIKKLILKKAPKSQNGYYIAPNAI